MKAFFRIVLSGLLALSISVQAQEIPADGPSGNPNEILKDILKNLQNLGAYLGYIITNPAPPELTATLLNIEKILIPQQYLFYTAVGAIPVNALLGTSTSTEEPTNLLVPSAGDSSYLNKLANKPFTTPNAYSNANGSVAVSPLIDQQTYLPDPVNQAVLNILTTPDDTYCMNANGTDWVKDCKFLYQSQVVSNVLGELPGVSTFFTFDYNQSAVPQLNSNSLTGPLLYTMQPSGNANSSGGASSTDAQNQTTPLTAQDQGQLAANYIRYATGAVAPLNLPKWTDYNHLWGIAVDGDLTLVQRSQAKSAIMNYLASLRVYAAQVSVGYSNLYYILGKRMPQNQNQEANSAPVNTSQALSEFNMANWRLHDPDGKEVETQWIGKINKASPATVQKEMALLLAEINYQLYLNRQQEERILLTQTMLLLQNSRSTQPSLSSATTTTASEEGTVNP